MNEEDYDEESGGEYEYEYEYSDGEDNESQGDISEYRNEDEDDSSPLHQGCVRKDPPSNDEDTEETLPKNSEKQRRRQETRGEEREGKTCMTVDIKSLEPITNKRVSDVVEALGVPQEAAALLLGKYRWNTQRALEAYFEGDVDSTLRAAGIFYRCNPEDSMIYSAMNQEALEQLCSICFDFMTPSNSMAMPCGHRFCLNCWRDFLTNAIVKEGATCFKRLPCPHAGCQEAVTETEIQQAAPELLERYRSFRLSNFVESCGRWCPTPGCDRAVVTRGSSTEKAGGCGTCGALFCLGCGTEPHAPLTCQVVKKWEEKQQSDSETANWMMVNTKNCPKCGTRIEKNGGCMYIKCYECKHGFCWICMGEHHVYTCNAYKEPDETTNEKLRAKNELERYMHYFNRYKGHHDAQEFAEKQLKLGTLQELKEWSESSSEEAKNRITKEKLFGNAWGTQCKKVVDKDSGSTRARSAIDNSIPDFLREANEQLVICRRVLKHNYVFAYYEFQDSTGNEQLKQKQERFEFHQGTLEMLTEGLSKATETTPDEMDRQEVVNRTRAIGQFIRNLVEYVQDGMEDETAY